MSRRAECSQGTAEPKAAQPTPRAQRWWRGFGLRLSGETRESRQRRLSQSPRLLQRLVWHPHATDNQVLADIVDLVERMAELTGRKLRWSRPAATEKRSLLRRTTASLARALPERSADGGKHYAAFISHYRAEAGSEARYLQGRLAMALGRPIFLDATDAM